MLKEFYTDVKAWFKYSWSIFIARLETLLGLLTTTVAVLDLAPLLGAVQAGLSKTQMITIGAFLFVKGLISEIGRRQGTVELSDGQMIPAKISEKKEAIEIIKEAK